MDKKYIKSLRAHVLKVLAPLAIPDSSEDYETQRKALVKRGPMQEWARSRRHRSFDPNPETNFETREYSGDAILAAVIAVSVTNKNPKIDPEMLTDLKNSKLWKGEQARLSDQLHLSDYLLTNVPVTIDDKEDLFEAMFGTLHYIGDRYFNPGTGFILCRNAFIALYGDMVIELDKLALKSPLNQLKEIGDKLKWFEGAATIKQFGVPRKLENNEGKTIGHDLTYVLTPKAKEWLTKRRQTIVNNGIIAHQVRHTQKDTKLAAVQEALINLKKYYDIDWYSADEYNRQLGPKAKNPTLLSRMKKDNIIDVVIVSYKVDEKDGAYYQLLGVDEEGSSKILLTIINELKGRSNIKRQIMDFYERNGAQNPNEHIRISD